MAAMGSAVAVAARTGAGAPLLPDKPASATHPVLPFLHPLGSKPQNDVRATTNERREIVMRCRKVKLPITTARVLQSAAHLISRWQTVKFAHYRLRWGPNKEATDIIIKGPPVDGECSVEGLNCSLDVLIGMGVADD